MKSLNRTRSLLELQGYVALSDRAVTDIDAWLRVGPAICAGSAFLATLTGATNVLILLATIACLGAMLPWQPFDLPYNLMIHHWTGTAPIPRSRAPRRFACGVAAIWLSVTAAAIAAGASWLGVTLGVVFTIVALVPVATGLCVPSWVLSRLGYRTPCCAPACSVPQDAR
jgi:hypothetical protein